jgi:glucose-1-phosphate thymidylyltransferase
MQVKKAILTGGGRATRLRPITSTINKHLIPLANKPMIFHAIDKAVEAGVTEIFINTNPGETQLQKAIGDGSHWGISITFFEQEGGPQGIAHVVKCAEKFIGSDPFMFYLSDNIILGSLKPFFDQFANDSLDCMLAFAKVPDPERFGVPVFNEAGELVRMLEKPSNPPNNFAQTGIYLYGPNVFFDAFDHIEKSPRGEYEISDIHTYFLEQGKKVGWKEITGWWKDTGKPEDLLLTNKLLLDEVSASAFAVKGTVASGAKVSGKVHVGVGTTIGNNVTITGPVMIGENCVLDNCSVGPYVTIGSGSTIKQMTIEESMIFGNCTIESPLKLKQSIIGESVTVKNPVGESSRLILGDYTLAQL